MSVYTEDFPSDVFRLRLRAGEFKLNEAPHYVHPDGWRVYHLNVATVDWTDSLNAARAQVFPNVKPPAVDLKWEAIAQARIERAKAAA